MAEIVILRTPVSIGKKYCYCFYVFVKDVILDHICDKITDLQTAEFSLSSEFAIKYTFRFDYLA